MMIYRLISGFSRTKAYWSRAGSINRSRLTERLGGIIAHDPGPSRAVAWAIDCDEQILDDSWWREWKIGWRNTTCSRGIALAWWIQRADRATRWRTSRVVASNPSTIAFGTSSTRITLGDILAQYSSTSMRVIRQKRIAFPKSNSELVWNVVRLVVEPICLCGQKCAADDSDIIWLLSISPFASELIKCSCEYGIVCAFFGVSWGEYRRLYLIQWCLPDKSWSITDTSLALLIVIADIIGWTLDTTILWRANLFAYRRFSWALAAWIRTGCCRKRAWNTTLANIVVTIDSKVCAASLALVALVAFYTSIRRGIAHICTLDICCAFYTAERACITIGLAWIVAVLVGDAAWHTLICGGVTHWIRCRAFFIPDARNTFLIKTDWRALRAVVILQTWNTSGYWKSLKITCRQTRACAVQTVEHKKCS